LEVWTLSKSDENTLAIIHERKIFGHIKENGIWRICTNQEFMDLYREPDISEIREGRLQLS